MDHRFNVTKIILIMYGKYYLAMIFVSKSAMNVLAITVFGDCLLRFPDLPRRVAFICISNDACRFNEWKKTLAVS